MDHEQILVVKMSYWFSNVANRIVSNHIACYKISFLLGLRAFADIWNKGKQIMRRRPSLFKLNPLFLPIKRGKSAWFSSSVQFSSIQVSSSFPCSVDIRLSSSLPSLGRSPVVVKGLMHVNLFTFTPTLTRTRLLTSIASRPNTCHEKITTIIARFESVSFQGWEPYSTCAIWINQVPSNRTRNVRVRNSTKLLRCHASRRRTTAIENDTV